MSVSLWRYDPEKCDGKPCCGDCDLCKEEDDDDIYRWIFDYTISE